ncbi:MAG TPA: phage/plasmid primase, P4 family [Phenylobacterium sp.]
MSALVSDASGRLPSKMRAAQRWLVYRLVANKKAPNKKPSKVPYYLDGTPRSGSLDTPEDRAKLGTFEEAVSALATGRYAGLGFALGAPEEGSEMVWQGIDLDDLRTKHPELKSVARRMPGYVELSPSGDGVHALGYGLPFANLNPNGSGTEAYSRARYFTVTGRGGKGELADLADFVADVLRPIHASGEPGGGAPAAEGKHGHVSAPPIVTPELLEHLRSALGHIAARGRADDRGAWIADGHALKTLGEPGRELFHEFSALSEKYDAEDAEERWSGFKPNNTSFAAVFAKAQRLGWRNPGTAGSENIQGNGGRSEEDLALAFARENEPGLRYCAAWKAWLVWDGARWALDNTLLATAHARDLCRREAESCPDPRLARALGQERTVNAVERLARADRRLAATTEQWDLDPWLLNTPGGVVDLRTGEVRSSDPALHMTKISGAAPGGDCPTWLRFLERITGGDVDLQAYLRRVLGYALTGVTSEQALFFAYGTGANGKSVLIDTVAGILGDYHKTAPVETFTESRSERHSTELAMLRGARLVAAVETEEGRRWAESKIKTLTGGDRISARFMHRDNFEYNPQFKLFIAGNHKPGLRSVDEAMRRRIHLVPFAVTIPAEERDPELKDKLRAEWAGILRWMIAGCVEWQRVGLAPPGAVRAATEDYLDEEDAISAWIDEMCERAPQGREQASVLFASWSAWAGARGEYVGSSKRFAQALEARGFLRWRTGQARGVLGLRLKPDPMFGAV